MTDLYDDPFPSEPIDEPEHVTEYMEYMRAQPLDEPILDSDLLKAQWTYSKPGDGTSRYKILMSISQDTIHAWREFVVLATGQEIRPGQGSLGSALHELAMRLLMASVAEFKVEDTAAILKNMLSDGQLENVRAGLRRLMGNL